MPGMGTRSSTRNSPTEEELLNRINDLISSNHIMIFSKSACPFCVQIKSLFKKLDAKFLSLELNDEEFGSELQNGLQKKTGQRTVPNVFIGGKHIGGCDSTKALHKSGELAKLIEN